MIIPQGFWIAAHPPHPRTSALFVDFMLSKSGQEIMAGQGRWVSRKDVKYLVDPGQKKLQVVSYENGVTEPTRVSSNIQQATHVRRLLIAG